MLGRVLNTLSCRLNREEAEWRSGNIIRNEMAYGRLRGWLTRIAERPISWSIAVLGLSLIVSFALWFLADCWNARIASNFDSIDLVEYFSALWSVQAGLAALVYPIVIAFVTLLLQRRYNPKSLLHVYLHDSAAIVSGLSALCLLILMTIQYLFLTMVTHQTAISWILVSGTWFLGNLIVTSFFLYQTFEFIRPSRRAKIIRQYVINVAWPQELREYLASLFLHTAIEQKLLPGPSYGGQQDERKPSVWPGLYSSGFGTPVVERFLPRNSRLVDVRFRPLAWSTSRWLKRANSSHAAGEPENRSLRRLKSNDDPVLVYPLSTGSNYSGRTALCRVIGPIQPLGFERILVRLAFKFRQSSQSVELTVGDVFDDLKGEAMSYLQGGETQAFSAAVDELVDVYSLVIEASACKNTEGNVDSYARVSSVEQPFSALYRLWARRLVDLSMAAAERLGSEEAFFTDLINVPNHLFSRLSEEETQPDILCHLIELPRIFFYRVAVWWTRTVEQQGTTRHDACNPSSLRPPFFGTYNSVLVTFVGTWESLKNHYLPPRRSETPTWLDLQRASSFFERHLHETALMVMECVHRGDQVGAENMLDVLLSWFGQLHFRFETDGYLFRRKNLVSFEVVNRSWEDIEGALDVEAGGQRPGEAPKAIFAAALQNYWVDVCCAITYMLAIRGKECPCDRSLPARILKGIVFGETFRRDTGVQSAKRPVQNANDLFMAILRQYHSEGAYRKGYRAKLDRLVERLAEVTKEPMIPGRVYSGWGGENLDSVRDGQLLVLALLVPEPWNPTNRIEPTMRQWVREDDAKLRELQDDLQQWKERLSSPEFGQYKAIFECVKAGRGGPSFEQATGSAGVGIDEMLTKVATIRTETLQDLPVSQNRLKEVGRWGSAIGFSKDSGGFPLRLFSTVQSSNESLQGRSLVLKGVAKGEYTEPEMAQRSVNEQELFERLLRDHVAASVLNEVVRRLVPGQEDGNSAEAYWEQVKRYGEKAKGDKRSPILLVENPTVPEWVYNWTNPYGKREAEIPSDMDVWHDPKLKSDAYLGNLNEIAVYVAPLSPGASVLITSESFQSLSFTRLDNGSFVSVESIPTEGQPAIIDLKLMWWFDVELDPYPAIKLSYGGRQRRRRRG